MMSDIFMLKLYTITVNKIIYQKNVYMFSIAFIILIAGKQVIHDADGTVEHIRSILEDKQNKSESDIKDKNKTNKDTKSVKDNIDNNNDNNNTDDDHQEVVRNKV